MATLVGNHQQSGITAPTNGDDLDADVVRTQVNSLRTGPNLHDADGGLHLQSGVAASRPGAALGNAGWKWVDSDTQRAYLSDGATWLELAYVPLVGGTAAGAIGVSRAVGNTCLFAQATGDTNPRVELDSDGMVRWGPGNGATDTYVYRSAAGLLATNAGLDVSNGIAVSSGLWVRTGALTVGVDPATGEPFRNGVAATNSTVELATFTNPSAGASAQAIVNVRTGSATLGLAAVNNGGTPGGWVFTRTNHPLVFGIQGNAKAQLNTDGSFVIGPDPSGPELVRTAGQMRIAYASGLHMHLCQPGAGVQFSGIEYLDSTNGVTAYFGMDYTAQVVRSNAVVAGWGHSFLTQGTQRLSITATAVTIAAGTNLVVGGSATFAGGSFAFQTSAALTNFAGIGAGTLTNAPSAGNPTKWVAIIDNGVTRYIPTWT